MKCTKCGSEFTGNFCSNCGTPTVPQNQPPNRPLPKKKSHGCLVTIFIFFLFTFGLCVGISQMAKNPEQYDSSWIANKYIDVSVDEGIIIDDILISCGISTVQNIEHDELLDNAHLDGETGYRIKINSNLDNIILYLNPDNTVYLIKYADYELYANNSVLATIQDYTFTIDEISKWQVLCQDKIKELLKSPSSAKFPNYTQWGFKKEKNIITIQGYVDADNSFGANLRSTFQFIIDADTNMIQSLIFDGTEMIQ